VAGAHQVLLVCPLVAAAELAFHPGLVIHPRSFESILVHSLGILQSTTGYEQHWTMDLLETKNMGVMAMTYAGKWSSVWEYIRVNGCGFMGWLIAIKGPRCWTSYLPYNFTS
jgi:hypothetical protein